MVKGSRVATEGSSAGYDLAVPDPAALIESLRAFGYTPQSALADLIDNSLTAGARNIWIDLDWDGPASTVTVRDDGRGMTELELIAAMRPGSRSPLEERGKTDLGRFGLGLKTASFSQCRRLTVASQPKKSTSVALRCWDLDLVVATGEWRLMHTGTAATAPLTRSLGSTGSGTVVVWELLDRIVATGLEEEDEKAHRRFLELVRTIRRHLSLTFHRFMSGRSAVTIHLNGRPLEPWDPFELASLPGGQTLEHEALPYRGTEIVVDPYVLPHRNRLTEEQFRYGGLVGGGPEDDPRQGGVGGAWSSRQGFYVYRGRRLLVAGDYLGLGFLKEDHYRLARIAVEIGNQADQDWQIDVRKSVARPPGILREPLSRIATVTRHRAVEVFRHRGRELTTKTAQGVTSTWSQQMRQGKITYRLNREHPLLKCLVSALPSPQRSALRALLNLVEETVPVPLIAINNAERQEQVAAPFEGDAAKAAKVALQIFQMLRGQGMSAAAARKSLGAIEPFDRYPELIGSLTDASEDLPA